VVDEGRRYRTSCRFKLEAELFLDRGEERWAGSILRYAAVQVCIRRPLQGEVVSDTTALFVIAHHSPSIGTDPLNTEMI
jgi:hypothetical protein